MAEMFLIKRNHFEGLSGEFNVESIPVLLAMRERSDVMILEAAGLL